MNEFGMARVRLQNNSLADCNIIAGVAIGGMTRAELNNNAVGIGPTEAAASLPSIGRSLTKLWPLQAMISSSPTIVAV
ncbi:hypothetical protein DERF_014324 [Dermatophagoides farinae]|uniref:Uncharacterized protein n=1 Tax=Dermatophagoides farinae TaxID=6954 RepID=A0A922KWM2_DERFA|nr:hypothetical protein DERF_014324 [Dermatophagoides farinae]